MMRRETPSVFVLLLLSLLRQLVASVANQPKHRKEQAMHCWSRLIRASAILLAAMHSMSYAQTPSRDAVQTVYQNGVPQMDKTGAPLADYDPQKSFFPIALWGAPGNGDPYSNGVNYSWQSYKNANFNTVWAWANHNTMTLMNDGKEADLQVVLIFEEPIATLQQIRDAPALRSHLLGVQWYDEPTSNIPENQMQSQYKSFQAYRQSVHQILPDTPVFVTDTHAYTNEGYEKTWWPIWASGGDIVSQDNYPIRPVTTSLGKTNGISDHISLSSSVVGQNKPVWAMIGAFEWTADAGFEFRFPSPVQLRAEVYTALIHGATGITYFGLDSYISRGGTVIGISPDPRLDNYTPPGTPGGGITATPLQVQKSLQIWNAVAATNLELEALTPVLLSPTISASELAYSVQLSNLSAPDSSAFAPNPVRTMLKKDGNGRYVLLAVNLDNRSVDATFDFSSTLSQLGLMFEDSGALSSLANVSSFTYHFEPFDTNVFIFTVPEPSSLGLISLGVWPLIALISQRRRHGLPAHGSVGHSATQCSLSLLGFQACRRHGTI